MKKRTKLITTILLAVSVNVSYGGENCLPPDVGSKQTPMDVFRCFQRVFDAQQNRIDELATGNLNLKIELEQLKQKLPNQKLPANTENCSAEQKGQIAFDDTYARLCNGINWQIMDARNPKPVLKASAKKYTIAEVRATAKDNKFGQGTVCETGYHLCIFMEALSLKYAYPRSRIAFEEHGYLRTLGNYTDITVAVGGTHPHNSLLGHKDSRWDLKWNGKSLQCPDGSGPMTHFQNKSLRNQGYEWTGGCYKDDKRYWACCINNLD
ncbi:hypothetical protein [Candidatus Parabeggiatoa sp. HSG14]|uniref:hypothetical protein n=1 Tax=Candidatus Parabeggiatoa sp. HSG14 TaxID=3055593 RepID=UPI0025A78593|nr:hypothetical protein [Thiotrichales bacterium HSG14]